MRRSMDFVGRPTWILGLLASAAAVSGCGVERAAPTSKADVASPAASARSLSEEAPTDKRFGIRGGEADTQATAAPQTAANQRYEGVSKGKDDALPSRPEAAAGAPQEAKTSLDGRAVRGVAPHANLNNPAPQVVASTPSAPPTPPQAYAAPMVPTAPMPTTAPDVPIDPNGRFATTYRPGGGHLAAFESAVARGVVPSGEEEIVSDIGARYAPSLAKPSDKALAVSAELERGKIAPSGGPLHVRIDLQSTAEHAVERPHLSVVVVLDVSGSMRGQLISSARKAATALVDKLDATDDFSLVTFSSEATLRVPMGPIGKRRDSIKQTISEVVEGGGTNIGEGLRIGYEQASDKKVPADAEKVVMLLSDGRANDGITNPNELSRLALGAFQDGIQTSSFGLGTDYDGPLMSSIANDGAGGYYYLRDAQQIPAALTTEIEKRLDPVATAVEVRVRLKPGIDLLDAYGSRRLNDSEASRVRAIEVATDQQAQKRDHIKANRQDDLQGGMRFFIPAYARDESHAILLKLRLPEGVGAKDIALLEVKYKDRVTKKNVAEEIPVRSEYANSDAESAKTTDESVARTVQGFEAGETLMLAANAIQAGDHQRAVALLGEREGLLDNAAVLMKEPLFLNDSQRLERLRVHAGETQGPMADPLVLAMAMETAGNVHMR